MKVIGNLLRVTVIAIIVVLSSFGFVKLIFPDCECHSCVCKSCK